MEIGTSPRRGEQTQAPVLQYYNKLYGLKLLEEVFKGVNHASVIPYRVYRKPEEFEEEIFRNAQRILIRSNLEGNNPVDAWKKVPRKEINEKDPANIRGTAIGLMQNAKKEWKSLLHDYLKGLEWGNTKPNSLHFIVSEVAPRKSLLMIGKLRRDYVNLQFKDFDKHDWRGERGGKEVKIQSLTENDLTELRQNEVNPKITPEEAKILAKAIKHAHEAIEEKIKPMLSPRESWEAWFTINPNSPTKPEFYDLIIKPQTWGKFL